MVSITACPKYSLPRHSVPARLRRLPLTTALVVALSLGAVGSVAQPLAPDPRRDFADYLAGHPLPADLSWLEAAHLEALARHLEVPSPVPADGRATIPVTNCNDSGIGSLRNAIAIAADNDTVDAGGLSCSSITLTSGALAVAQNNLFIQGPGREALTIRPGTKYRRVVTHIGTGTLAITGVTLANGSTSTSSNQPDARGGCVFSEGTVVLGNMLVPADRHWGTTVVGCSAMSNQAGVTARGGGVFAVRGMAMYASTITGCSAQASTPGTSAMGGGVYSGFSIGPEFRAKYSEFRGNEVVGAVAKGGAVTTGGLSGNIIIENSTIAGNNSSGDFGGAYLVAANTSDVSIRNVTISGNTGASVAGMLINTVSSGPGQGMVRVQASTITRNNNRTMATAAGLSVMGSLEIASSIVSGNTFEGSSPRDFTQNNGALTGADNLIGFALTTAPPTGLISSNEPGLAALADNGGPTRTHALLPDSPARNAGNNSAGSSFDQRGTGFPRVTGARADIGSLEGLADLIFENGFE